MAVLLALALGACAAQEAETPAQTVYALQSDYAAAQVAALGYLESAAPTPTVVAAIRDADAAAMDALTAAQTAVRAGDNPALPALIATARHAVRQLARLVPDTWGPLADF